MAAGGFADPFSESNRAAAWEGFVARGMVVLDGGWAEATGRVLADAAARSWGSYLRFAVALNGCHVAAERYRDPSWSGGFYVEALRRAAPGAAEVRHERLVTLTDGALVADMHLSAARKLLEVGVVDLLTQLEITIFALYRQLWLHEPGVLLRGPEARDLRALERAGETRRAEYEAALRERIDAWERNKRMTPLGRTFAAYCRQARLEAPQGFTSRPDDWADALTLMARLRNALVHGADTVPGDLAEASATRYNASLTFTAGEPLEVDLLTLQTVALTMNDIIGVLLRSVAEKVGRGLSAR